MDLFDYMREQNKETSGPLASRMRPTTLDEVVGQQHIVGKDKLLYRAIKAISSAPSSFTATGHRKDYFGKGHSPHYQC